MKRTDGIDDLRRLVLIRALSAGLLRWGLTSAQVITFGIFGSRPRKLPQRTIHLRLVGQCDRERPASYAGDPHQGRGHGSNCAKQRGCFCGQQPLDDSACRKQTADRAARELHRVADHRRVAYSKWQAAVGVAQFGKRVTSSTATIDIRGTGFYIESDPERTYFCTCYGTTEVQATNDPQSKETISASHHDRPLYIVADGGSGNNIRNAPFANHSDQELAQIETLVGRRTPFVFSNDVYTGPRRTY